ncbi:tRNA (adenosine(37)-N6)-threonylcarbamoyltransferase complex ATPase subunit type 1 TsaE [Sedimentitalea sp. HM32M-2]|uniref:tRNA (adenosine(37)-N6)-threonylcarbamoyltransferase complex ATPase subunit type 1 TsaE n=1 Tax=Sedimentitalea sp. HM32M-2 TaxID=3351566 RepID=UPI003636EA5C
MIPARRILTSRSPEETAGFAAALGARLAPGDCLLLQGPIGAGKTHFARHLIQSLLAEPEDVPSPTYTLVQTYDTRCGALWHADLYRLNTPDEIEELGLTEAFETAICLVEWPEKLGPLAPDAALQLTFETDPHSDDTRRIHLQWQDRKWDGKLEQMQNA